MVPQKSPANSEWRWSRLSIRLLLFGLTAAAQMAQQQPPANLPQATDPTAPLAISEVNPETYVIRPYDILLIREHFIREHSPSELIIVCPVAADGTISLAKLDLVIAKAEGLPPKAFSTLNPVRPKSLEAEGLTLAQLRTQLVKTLSIDETQVTVTLSRRGTVSR